MRRDGCAESFLSSSAPTSPADRDPDAGGQLHLMRSHHNTNVPRPSPLDSKCAANLSACQEEAAVWPPALRLTAGGLPPGDRPFSGTAGEEEGTRGADAETHGREHHRGARPGTRSAAF
ncbi:hypothetical protein AAFF_G00352700 [Aldrovandia affinis]|uniref:Uncharacterized protein n=1 Tax=Aldrovandia affinis TaxID=143900 RepID=A0AAD7WNS3_9TELE|nr:hypothetical protein AAFF_G00352700 [Aldrovandia affinis]